MKKHLKFRSSTNGQTHLLILITLVTVLAFTFMIFLQGLRGRAQIQTQIAADQAATAGVLWEARTYNLVAGINKGIIVFLTTFLIAAVILIVLVACSATVVCAALLASLQKPLQEIMDRAWDIATALSNLERKIAKVAPLLVLGQTLYMGQKNQIDGLIPYPYLPENLGADREQKHTLSLFLVDGGLGAVAKHMTSSLPENMKPYTGVVFLENASQKNEMSDEVSQPDPLVLAEEFRERIKLGTYAWKTFPGEKIPLFATAQAIPFLPGVEYGEEDLFEMNWRVRLEDVDFLDDLGVAGKIANPETLQGIQSQIKDSLISADSIQEIIKSIMSAAI